MNTLRRWSGPAGLAPFFLLALLTLLVSCVSVSLRTSVPPAPEYIMGQGKVSSEQLARFLVESNPGADRSFTGRLAEYYVKEAAAEGVNHDVAFAQMCLETGFLRYGGLVTPDMNNFCGLGSTGPEHPGEIFPEPRIGVRAHIQHLKAYATTAPLNQKLVDPRYRWVRYGSSPGIQGLAGTWAADRAYGEKLETVLERLYLSAFNRNQNSRNRSYTP